MGRRVLSLDWDWFTGDRGDGDGCCGWSCSYSNNRGRGTIDCEPPETESDEGIPIIPRSVSLRTCAILQDVQRVGVLVVAECHGSLAALIQDGDEIHHLDAHHDGAEYDPNGDYPREGRVTCGNWVTVVRRWHKGVTVTHLPDETYRRPDGVWCNGVDNMGILSLHPEYDLVFVCKSSPWTPKSLDIDLHRLIKYLAARCPTGIRWYGHRARELRKEHARLLPEGV